jgi:hypothetical protein
MNANLIARRVALALAFSAAVALSACGSTGDGTGVKPASNAPARVVAPAKNGPVCERSDCRFGPR